MLTLLPCQDKLKALVDSKDHRTEGKAEDSHSQEVRAEEKLHQLQGT